MRYEVIKLRTLLKNDIRGNSFIKNNEIIKINVNVWKIKKIPTPIMKSMNKDVKNSVLIGLSGTVPSKY